MVRVTRVGLENGKVAIEWSPDGRLASPDRVTAIFPVFSLLTPVALMWALPLFTFWKIRDFIWWRLFSPTRRMRDEQEDEYESSSGREPE